MFESALAKVFGTQHDRDIKRLQPFVGEINEFEDSISKLTDEEIKAKSTEFRSRLADGETLDDILPEAFAV